MKSRSMSRYMSNFESKKNRNKIVADICKGIYYQQYFDRIVYFHHKTEGRFTEELNSSINPYWFNKSQLLDNCGSFLEFARNVHDIDDYKLVNANFCRLRICPMCSWRRELKLFSEMTTVMSYLTDPDKLKTLDIPKKYKCGQNYKFLFVTFTLKNCTADNLDKTIDTFQKAYARKLMRWNRIKNSVYGHYRALEVTYNKENKTFHPHYHCIWAVPSNYFHKKGKYISQEELTSLWASASDIDYVPIIDIRKIKGQDDSMDPDQIASAVAEVCKYPVKDSDFADLDNFSDSAFVLQTFDNMLSGRRLISFSGIFKEVRKVVCTENISLTDSLPDKLDQSVEYVIDSYIWHNGYHYADFGQAYLDWRKACFNK